MNLDQSRMLAELALIKQNARIVYEELGKPGKKDLAFIRGALIQITTSATALEMEIEKEKQE